MRLHFDMVDHGDDRSFDEDGIEFADFATMQKEALRAAGTMVSELTEFSLEPWTMTIRNDQRQTVATLTFSASYDIKSAACFHR